MKKIVKNILELTDTNNSSAGSEYEIIASTTNSTGAQDQTCENFTVNSEINPDSPEEYSNLNIPPKFIH